MNYTNGAWQTVKVSKLPKYIWNGNAYVEASYYVVETGVDGDTKITYKKDAGTEGEASAQATRENATITIYNKDYAIDIGIIKIDENTREATQKKLPEAEFKLLKLTKLDTSSTETYTIYPNDTDCLKTTNSEGILTFDDLSDGKYRIDETQTPAGYVAYQKVEISFAIENGEVRWTDSNGTVIESQIL